MSRVGRNAHRESRMTYTSWTVYYGTHEDGQDRRNRRRFPNGGRDAAREYAKELTTRGNVIWITVYPPIRAERKTYKWTRANGWSALEGA